MSRRTIRSLILGPLGLACVSVALAGCGTSSAASATSSDANNVGTSLNEAVPASILDLPLTDSSGLTVHLADFRGDTIMLSDNMTLCQETCPLDTATLVQTARDENANDPHAKIVYLSVTVDPVRDTPSQLAAYKQLFRPVPANWHELTGSPATIDKLWNFLGVWRQKAPEGPGPAPKNWRTGAPLTYDVGHSDEVFFLDARGHERFVLEGPPATARGLIPPKLYTFMSANGHKLVATPPNTDWTEAQARQELTALAS